MNGQALGRDGKPAIMFVDDEAHVLSGLRRMLRHKAQDWTMLFANSGPEALTLAGASTIDVVVSDMRMPEMDGAMLLREIEARHPRTIRFVLSGQSDSEVAHRSVGASHQYLSKPCDGRLLEEKIEQALVLRNDLGEVALTDLLSRLDLPVKPPVYENVTRCLRDEYVVSRELTRIVSDCHALAGRVLQVANATIASGRRIGSIDTAIGMIGFETLKSLAIEQGTIAQMRDGAAWQDVLRHQQTRSLALAETTRRLGRFARADRFRQADCYTAGLLASIGVFVLADNLGQDYRSLIEQRSEPLATLEERLLGAGHSAVSAFLLSAWGLPSTVVEAVLHIHAEPGQENPPSTASILRAANQILGDHTADDLRVETITALPWLPSADGLAGMRREAIQTAGSGHA